jgi:glyoxylase-like metal-dependent hydrolase (beta-lactamase superfamily II)/rhodanese-related sulfurtransferase
MIFRQYYLACLSHASYLIGDEHTGRAVVVDPQRDISGYLTDAQEFGLAIERVIETHFHADFLSGHLELAHATGAVISYGEAAKPEFVAELLADGHILSLGDVTLQILATPGHTPESISIVVKEHPNDVVPYGVLTGDTLFIGDVGRPDLLTSVGVSAEELASELYDSLHNKLLTLPDATRVFPAHGAGSSCGKKLSNETESTIGVQRVTNYALAPMTKSEFIESVTQGLSVAPLYFSFSAMRNKMDRPLLDESESPALLSRDEMLQAMARGAKVLDTRDAVEYQVGHLEGSLNVPLAGRFAEYVGEVIRSDSDIVLVCALGTEYDARVRLARIGFDRVIGALREPLSVFHQNPEMVRQSSRLTVSEFNERRGSVSNLQVIDVRMPTETELGVVPGAKLLPLPQLITQFDKLRKDQPIVVYCESGVRSSIAASALRSEGFVDVSDVIGGYGALETLP